MPPQRITSPDLARSDFHLFPQIKEYLCGEHISPDDDVKATAKLWLGEQDTQLYRDFTRKLRERLSKRVVRSGDYVEK